MKIKLNSRHLKAGDKIIRVKPINEYNGSFVNHPLEVVNKTSTHIVVVSPDTQVETILDFYKWNDENWVRWKF